jgi:hypothetical protein
MNTIPIYRKGAWVHYNVPGEGTAMWSQSIKLKVASLYATAISNGYSQETSTVLAECFANKELYGVRYTKDIETILQKFFV